MKAADKALIRDYFKGRIDYHVNGMLASNGHISRFGLRNRGIEITGDVTDREIVAKTKYETAVFEGGHYSNTKRNGCYAPLMPKYVGTK